MFSDCIVGCFLFILGRLSVCICIGDSSFLLNFNVVLDDLWTKGIFLSGRGSWTLFVIYSLDYLRNDLDLMIYFIFAFYIYLLLSNLLLCFTYALKLIMFALFFSTILSRHYISTFFYFQTILINPI